MKRSQVFVRAKLERWRNNAGQTEIYYEWVNADVLDLDPLSFQAFIIDRLIAGGAVVSVRPEYIEDEEISYKVRTDCEWKYKEDQDGS